MPLRPLAIYLPQFHPIPENDEWWGKGFTEWTNVTRTQPYFNGHYQPHLPADLGFYDLRLPEIMVQQAALAKQYGIYGFCFYHYWFNGKRLLHQPLDNMLATQTPDFPFCLCWANENWSRRWDGMNQDVLIAQHYSDSDDVEHIRFLIEHFFKDPRYITIEGKPLFLVYRSELLPDAAATARRWRNEAQKAGLPDLYLARVESFTAKIMPDSIGFDASVEFQPDWRNIPKRFKIGKKEKWLQRLKSNPHPFELHKVFSYQQLCENMLQRPPITHKRFPCVTPMWDNSARRKKDATIFHDSTPQLYENWLRTVVQNFMPYSPEENFIFLNAWNEWAEGNHLEPCQKWGHAYLEATKNALTL
ncbi:MAG: glycoside hydrolase family 99-like domain-containing protein [Sphingobacteriales bacterium]|nr:glycoside hydrolase family 99-like domain-containing protein [Sphingobacteriales bacterium]